MLILALRSCKKNEVCPWKNPYTYTETPYSPCPRTGDVLIVGDGTFPCARAHFLRFDQGRWPNFTPTISAYPKIIQNHCSCEGPKKNWQGCSANPTHMPNKTTQTQNCIKVAFNYNGIMHRHRRFRQFNAIYLE